MCIRDRDNGASVLRQLSELVQGEVSEAPDQPVSSSTAPTTAISLDETAANDIDRRDLERMTGSQLLIHTLLGHWKSLIVDASVCAIAAGIAINLIN